MESACLFFIGHEVDSDCNSLVLSLLLCFWIHSISVKICSRPYLFIYSFFNCPLGLRSSRADWEPESKSQPVEKETAKRRNQQSKEQDGTSWLDKQMKQISHGDLQTTTERHKMHCRKEETWQEMMKGSRWETERRTPSTVRLPFCLRVCACSRGAAWNLFFPAAQPLTWHTDLLTALVTVTDNCCRSCCWKIHLESYVCLCTPQDCQCQQHKQVGRRFFTLFFWNKSAQEYFIVFPKMVLSPWMSLMDCK